MTAEGWGRYCARRSLHWRGLHHCTDTKNDAGSANEKKMHFARCVPAGWLLLNARLLVAAAAVGDGQLNCRPKRCLPIKLNARPARMCTAPLLHRPLRHFVLGNRHVLSLSSPPLHYICISDHNTKSALAGTCCKREASFRMLNL